MDTEIIYDSDNTIDNNTDVLLTGGENFINESEVIILLHQTLREMLHKVLRDTHC